MVDEAGIAVIKSHATHYVQPTLFSFLNAIGGIAKINL
jgi:hypothetical protein